jgi:hypothetical protein
MDLKPAPEADIERVRRMVGSAFPAGPPPHRTRITPHECHECSAVADSLAGRVWTELPAALIDEHHDNLPLLTAEAFHYFFPAFLLRALDPFDPDNKVCRGNIIQLSPTQTPVDDPGYLALVRPFSEAERAAVVAFLQLVLADERFFITHKNAERALRKHWLVPEKPGGGGT